MVICVLFLRGTMNVFKYDIMIINLCSGLKIVKLTREKVDNRSRYK